MHGNVGHYGLLPDAGLPAVRMSGFPIGGRERLSRRGAGDRLGRWSYTVRDHPPRSGVQVLLLALELLAFVALFARIAPMLEHVQLVVRMNYRATYGKVPRNPTGLASAARRVIFTIVAISAIGSVPLLAFETPGHGHRLVLSSRPNGDHQPGTFVLLVTAFLVWFPIRVSP
jgi:hypothetical protein